MTELAIDDLAAEPIGLRAKSWMEKQSDGEQLDAERAEMEQW